jgi:hypothetical protein
MVPLIVANVSHTHFRGGGMKKEFAIFPADSQPFFFHNVVKFQMIFTFVFVEAPSGNISGV